MKKVIFIILGILVVFGLFYMNINSKKEKPQLVKLEKINRGTLKSIVTASGHVQPATVVDISSDVAGRIMSIKVKEGDKVTKGQTLCILDDAQYRTQVDQLQASYESAKASVRLSEARLQQAKDDLERKRALLSKGAVSEEVVQELEVALKVAEAEKQAADLNVTRSAATLEAAADSYGKTIIRSPMDGVVSQQLMEVGEIVITGMTNVSGTVIMRVADLAVMEAEINVDETDVVDLKIGQETKISVEAMTDTSFKGRVSEIANSAVIRGSGTAEEVTSFNVKITILDSIPGLRPGMSVSIDIITDTVGKALNVPIQAVVMRDTTQENESYAKKISKNKNSKAKVKIAAKKVQSDSTKTDVDSGKATTDSNLLADVKKEAEGIYILEKGRAKFIPVTTGIADEKNIEIKTELTDSTKVVTGSYKILRKLKSGDAIKSEDDEKKSKKNKDKEKED
jgi:HlyD family secretion protein